MRGDEGSVWTEHPNCGTIVDPIQNKPEYWRNFCGSAIGRRSDGGVVVDSDVRVSGTLNLRVGRADSPVPSQTHADGEEISLPAGSRTFSQPVLPH